MGIGNRVIGDGLGGGSGTVAVSDLDEAIEARFPIDLPLSFQSINKSSFPLSLALYLLNHIFPYLSSLGFP